MFILPLSFMILFILKYKSCSLLSRLKNRYEYNTHDNDINPFTEDLYDFELTYSRLTTRMKSEILRDTSSAGVKTKSRATSTSYTNDTYYDVAFYKQSTVQVRKMIDVHDNSTLRPKDEPFSSLRPTIKPSFTLLTHISSSKRKKTWATYFPRKTLRSSLADKKRASTDLFEWISLKSFQSLKHNDIFDMIKDKNESTTAAQIMSGSLDDGDDKMTTLNIQEGTSKKGEGNFVKKGINEITPTAQIETTLQNLIPKEDVINMIKDKDTTKTTAQIDTMPPNETTQKKSSSKRNDIFGMIKDKNATKRITKLTTKSSSNVSTVTKAHKRQSKRTSCYMCGLNETEIPMPYCYYTFEGGDMRFTRGKHHFKVKCVKSETQKKVKNVYYGPSYRGGCFKRYLDVGVEYNERGCRTDKPTKGKSFASVRLAKLEQLISHKDDGCITSPHASITPFNRAVSLYTHYHVCVCSQKYCNRSCINNYNSYLLLLFLVDTIINSVCFI